MPYFEAADGTRLFYKEWGAGKPVVFLASAALNADMWNAQYAHLAGHGMRCIGLDRRGHGRSDQPGTGYDYDTLADDVAGLIGHLDLSEAVLVGHSMAGGEIVRYLTRHGAGRIAGIVLAGVTAPFLLQTADNPEGLSRDAIEAVLAAQCSDRPQWLADNTAAFFGPSGSFPKPVADWLIAQCLQTSLQAALECTRIGATTDLRGEMATIVVRTLIVHGEHDVSAPLALTGARSAALIPDSRLCVYESAAHALFMTHAERLNRDLLTFCQAAEPPAVRGPAERSTFATESALE